MTQDEWGVVRVRKILIDEIQRKLKEPKYKKMGFETYSGFVNYLITRELDRYSK